ncbi:CIC11C00000000813 [Sungouiella intermedia]|uniref:CIC11C00000000813 n=1 Tax=Sungouiella intermedia TaxID=45354 RepID=A0A1L0DDA1_9ASCO|nr:CIC11C00000000813 [[Candida] intermedia]
MVLLEDLFISDEEVEYCPLCVEEMDISDKNFKPCPCGYQICQFCYNNIRQNPELNGRCPGCRRLYDDESVEYKTLTAEEYKLQQFKKERRERDKKQREKERKELEIASKKHLAGLRVVQKNLVYVTGLNPPCPPEDLHLVLRSDKYFGQYGKILKIVINRKTPAGPSAHQTQNSNQGIVVYVTFAKKEDALRCINELDGSVCDGRVLRAAHGTTKYCLSYLRGHPCPNPNCMFLHEPGEEADSYTRKDLSTQQGIKMGMSGLRSGSGVNLHQSHFGEHEESDDERHSTVSSSVGTTTAVPTGTTPVATHAVPVLPATAHWAKNMALDSASSSPAVSNVLMADSAAFPTLGEIFKDQKLQKKDAKKKSKSNKDGTVLPDDIDIDDNLAFQIAEDASERLKQLSESNRALKVYFDDLSDAQPIPLFHFDRNMGPYSGSLDEEKVLARQVIERFLLRPIKKYHLAYLNHPVSQQQQYLTQQAHLQQQLLQQPQQQQQVQLQQLQTPLVTARLQQMHLDESQKQQQQQQQQMLLMQLQQQVHQGNVQGNAQGNVQGNVPAQGQFSQINALRMSQRGAATPPPPGLFGKNQDVALHPSTLSNQSSSSQLLTQLMSGK